MVESALSKWQLADGDARRPILEKALPNGHLRRRFDQLVRELVREGVPVGRFEVLLRCGWEEGTLFDALEHARAALIDELPGRDARPVRLPQHVESMLKQYWERNKEKTLTLPEALDDEIRDLLERELTRDGATANGEDVAFVVSIHRLRPYVSRLVDRHFPGVPVLSSAEVPDTRPAPEPAAEPPLYQRVRSRIPGL
jgi:flagellar biosynthesis component FlhA